LATNKVNYTTRILIYNIILLNTVLELKLQLQFIS
jgi:hypothetical protein